MKKIILINLLFIITLSAQEKVLTLEESVKTGLANSKIIKVSESEVKYAEAQLDEISSKFYPRVSLNASYARLSDVDPFEVSVPIFPAPLKIQDAILNNYSAKLSFAQPLFTGFRLSSLKSSAKKNYEGISLEHKSEINNEALKINIAFWNLYKAKETLKLVKKNIELVKSHVDNTKNLFENGMVTKNNLLNIEVRLSNLQLEKIKVENLVKMRRSIFLQTIGENLDCSIDISDETININHQLQKYDELLSLALIQRNELSSIKSKLEATEYNIESKKADWYPNVSLFSNLYYANPNQRIMPLKDEFKTTWDVGVALNWSLWNSGETSSKIVQAEEIKNQTEKRLELLRERIELEVYNNYLNVISSKEVVNVSKLKLEQAKENYRVSKNQYDEQMLTSTDLINAEASLLESEITLVTAEVDYLLAITNLEKAVGNKIY